MAARQRRHPRRDQQRLHRRPSDDVAARIRVQVTASNADGEVKATSSSVGPIAPTPPSSTAAPVLSGATKRGEMLTVTRGQWSDHPTNFTFVWQRDKGSGYATIAGATTSQYTLTATDVTARIRVNVTARNASGVSSAAPVERARPGRRATRRSTASARRSRHRRARQPLRADSGTWDGAGNTYRYQWQRYANGAWTNIPSATIPIYTPAIADEGLTLRVQVTATNPDGAAIAVSDADRRRRHVAADRRRRSRRPPARPRAAPR